MKTPLLFALLGIVLLSSVVQAGFFPQPVAGQIFVEDYPAPEGLQVVMTNTRNNVQATASVDENGFFLVDWANYAYRDGDKIQVTIKICAARPECTKYLFIEDGVPNPTSDASFSIKKGSEVVYNQITNTVYVYVCQDGSKVSTEGQCPVIVPPAPVVVEVVKIVCSDGTVVSDRYLCLETKEDVNKYLLAQGIGAGVIGAGFIGLVIYYIRIKKRKQAEKMLKTAIVNVRVKK